MDGPNDLQDAFNVKNAAIASGFAVLGGLVSFAQKVRAGKSKWVNFMELVGELITSAFAGVLVLLICSHLNFEPKVTGALVGISGWMGTRCLYLLESFLAEKFGIKDVPTAVQDAQKRRLEDETPATKYDPDLSAVTAAKIAKKEKPND